jgi:hypothetical protein
MTSEAWFQFTLVQISGELRSAASTLPGIDPKRTASMHGRMAMPIPTRSRSFCSGANDPSRRARTQVQQAHVNRADEVPSFLDDVHLPRMAL